MMHMSGRTSPSRCRRNPLQRPRPAEFLNFSSDVPGPALCQKLAALAEDEHFLLHDVTCLWCWLRPKMAKHFGTEIVDRHDELFLDGKLGGIGSGGGPDGTGNCPSPNFFGWQLQIIVGFPETPSQIEKVHQPGDSFFVLTYNLKKRKSMIFNQSQNVKTHRNISSPFWEPRRKRQGTKDYNHSKNIEF